MRGKEMLDAVSFLDPELIGEAEDYTAPRRSAVWKRIARTAAVVLLFAVGIGVFGLWLFMPVGGEQSARLLYVQIEDRLAVYEAVSGSRFDRLTLPYRTGELYAGSGLYRAKGSDHLAVLLRTSGDGSFEEYRFDCFAVLSEEDDFGWFRYAEVDPPVDPKSLRRGTYVFGDALDLVYAADGAEDLAEVRFSKADFDHTAVGRRVAVKPVSVKDAETLERIWEILRGLVRAGEDDVIDARIGAKSAAYLDGTAPLSVQTDRKITVRLKNGCEIDFLYAPLGGRLYENLHVLYEPLGKEDNRFLTELAEIDTAWRDWGKPAEPEGAETAVPPRIES